MINWLTFGIEITKTIATAINPIAGFAITAIEAVVNKKDDGISNDSVISVIKAMKQSKWNSLTTDKTKIMESVLHLEDNKVNQIIELFDRKLDSKDMSNLLNYCDGQS